MSRAALLGTFVFVVAGLSGCATPAKIIQQDSNSVVVAIPENTNVWPWYHKDEAVKAASAAIHDPVLVSSKRVKVGEQLTNRQDTTSRDINDKDKTPLGQITSSLSSTSVSDTYEYHLVFEKQSKSDVPNFSRSRTPPAPTPDGPPLTTVGGVISPKEPSGPIHIPANDVRMPMSQDSPSTSLPPVTLPPPGAGAGYTPR